MTERITLDAADAAELIEMLEFCCDWIDHDPALDESLRRFSGGPFGLPELHDALRRFADTLGHAPLHTNREQP